MIRLNKMPPPPSNSENHPACDTPNPPWWCDEAPQTPIDDGLWIFVIIALLIGIVYLITKYKDKEQL